MRTPVVLGIFFASLALVGCPKRRDVTADDAGALFTITVDDAGATAPVDAGMMHDMHAMDHRPMMQRHDAGVTGGMVGADAGKPKMASAPVSVPHCSNDQSLYAVDEHAKIFCASSDSCASDKDCNGKGTCTDAMIMQDDGNPALSHNGTPIGGKVCKPK